MFIGMQTLPLIYIDNNTNHILENISVSFDGDKGKIPSIQKIKPGERKQMSLFNMNVKGITPLYLMHENKKLKITERQYIFENFTKDFRGTILVEIKGIKHDGRFDITVVENYSLH
ncbi:hypothetical protein [Bacillus sp. MUM 13]|uniref:hypothetical protein n=1 Tax=Bacillus sp. MUM 13 TaxID=1678001 RepID=UPI0008F5C7B6|nr:hypothetical protein [Bacillus sp. MUM 13]OIK13197.1 hypothetical protein BIV59_06595 [Bacillus sp. MUM 13]